MGLQDTPIKNEYRSLIDNVVQDFYLPLLKEATTYKRAVGFSLHRPLLRFQRESQLWHQRAVKFKL